MTVPARRERAIETRRRMLEAARSVFAEQGYTAAMMKEIAGRAGVALQTLYFTFGNKGGLFAAVMKQASTGDGAERSVLEPNWFEAAIQARSPRTLLQEVVDGGSGIIERIGPLSAALTEAAAQEPALAEWRHEVTARRRQGLRRVAERLAELGALRNDLTHKQTADVLFVVLSPDGYRSFAAVGWTLSEWKAWVLISLERTLCREPDPGR